MQDLTDIFDKSLIVGDHVAYAVADELRVGTLVELDPPVIEAEQGWTKTRIDLTGVSLVKIRKPRGKPRADCLRVEPFREAYLRSAMTPAEFARLMGYMRNKTYRRDRSKVYRLADTTRAMRVLGIKPHSTGGRKHYNKTVTEEDAKKMLQIFPSLDPVDVGL